MNYKLIDSGHGRKLEQWGNLRLSRPAAQAIWKPKLPKKEWDQADALFSREEGLQWEICSNLPDQWRVTLDSLEFKVSPTDFGHLGLFPEHANFWPWITEMSANARVLNLFAYTGGATLAAARGGAEVCHLDASKGIVSWARENAALNNMQEKPIRWIVDDAMKFLRREIKRGSRYDGILLDPPSYGRGAKGEIFKIEDEIEELLSLCKQVLTDRPKFVLFTCHTPGFTPTVLSHLLEQMMGSKCDSGEMLLGEFPLPLGAYARWSAS